MRGSRTLSANHLVHITGVGTFQLAAIEVLEDPHSFVRAKKGAMDENVRGRVFLPDPDTQDSLQSENEIDHMAGEQTWPTEDELAEAGRSGMDGDSKVLSGGLGQSQRCLLRVC